MRVRTFLGISKLSRWLPRKLDAAHMAFWLGMLDEDHLNEVTAASYDLSSGFGSEQHNLNGLWPWETEAIRKAFPNCRTILVAAAGGGREAIALAKDGFSVTAFDSTSALTAACRENAAKAGVDVTVLDAEPDEIPGGLDRFDGLLVGRGAYHHIPGRQKRIQFLRSCAQHLVPDAPVFLNDFHVRPTSCQHSETTARIANAVRSIRRSQDRIEVGDHLNRHNYYHLFSREEIEAELLAAGFTVEMYADTPFGEGSSLAHALAISKGDAALN